MSLDRDQINTSVHIETASGARQLAAFRFRDISALSQAMELKLPELAAELSPVIAGLSAVLLPEDPAAAERVTQAVLQTLVSRWHKISKRSLVVVWLFRTTLIAARRERRCLRLPRIENKKHPDQRALLVSRLEQLAPRLRDPIILSQIVGFSTGHTAGILRKRERRVDKRITLGLKKLQKRLGKSGAEAGTLLRSIASAPGLAESSSRDWFEEPGPTDLVRATVSSWRWLRFRAVVKGSLATLGATIGVLATLFAVFLFLAHSGYLTPFFLRQEQKNMLRAHPELAIPPRAWPVDQDLALVPSSPPRTSAELFQMTNIWPVKLTFTRSQWDGIAPTDIPRVRNLFQDGRIILRNPKAKRSGLAGAVGIEFNWTEARLEFAGQTFDKVAVRYRGNGTFLQSRHGEKQSLKLDVNKVVKGQELAGIDELNFLNTIVDYSYMHDVMAEKLFRDLGVAAPRTAYAYITVEVPGEEKSGPRGLFVLMENIDNDFAKDRFGTKKTAIFKPVTYELFEDLGDQWEAYDPIYDVKTKANPAQQQRVIDFAKLVSHASDEEFARKLPSFLDIEEFAGFVAGHVLLSSYDGFLVNGQNYYVYLDPRTDKFGFISWDQDHSFGDFGHIGTTKAREDASIWEPSTYNFRFLKRVMKVELFREAYRAKLEEALSGPFTKENLYPRIDDLAKRIRPAVAAESPFRLKRFDQAVSDEWLPGPRDGAAEGPNAPVHQIKRFIENRIKSARAQLDGTSDGTRLAGFRD